MSDADESDHENDNHEPVPQQQITMLFSKDDFMDKVARDTEHLCCVIVTSTICVYSGLRDLTYPTTMDGVLKQRQELGMNDGYSDDDVHQDTDDNGNPDVNNAAEVSSNDAVNAALRRMPKLNSLSNSRFFDEVCKRLVTNRATVHQRRHVRVFNICACCEDEVNIRPLAVAMYGASGSQAAKHTSVKAVPAGGVGDYGTRDVAELNKLRAKAYANLVELLHMLNVRSTPAMLFFIQGQPLRYSRMLEKLPRSIKRQLTGKNDNLVATGCNYVKWSRIFHNAVVVRNAIMEKHDAEVREKRREEKRQARAGRRALERARRRQARYYHDEEDEYDH